MLLSTTTHTTNVVTVPEHDCPAGQRSYPPNTTRLTGSRNRARVFMRDAHVRRRLFSKPRRRISG